MIRPASLLTLCIVIMLSACWSDKSETARLQKAIEAIYNQPVDNSWYLIIPMTNCKFSLEYTIDFCRRNAVSIKDSERLKVIFTETPDTKTLNFMLGSDLNEVTFVDTASVFRDFDLYLSGSPLLVKCENGKVFSVEQIGPDQMNLLFGDLEQRLNSVGLDY